MTSKKIDEKKSSGFSLYFGIGFFVLVIVIMLISWISSVRDTIGIASSFVQMPLSA